MISSTFQPLTIKDIELHQVVVAEARCILHVKNKNRVKEFMENKPLQDFLRNPWDQNLAQRGCRLIIKYDEEASKLSVGRQFKNSTQLKFCYSDLVMSISSFVFALTKKSLLDLQDIAGKHPDMLYFFPGEGKELTEAQKKEETWVRALPFRIDRKVEQYKEDLDTIASPEINRNLHLSLSPIVLGYLGIE